MYNFIKSCSLICFNFFQRLTTETKVSDIKGKELPAVDIFSHAIRYLKNHLYDQLKNKGNYMYMQSENIEWVLTVPAIWDDPTKQFMRKAAEKVIITFTN